MKKEGLYCDTCDRKSEDICGDEGWIRMEMGTKIGSLTFSIADARDENGCAKNKTYKSMSEQLDFCSVRCMLEWMEIRKNAELSNTLPLMHDEIFKRLGFEARTVAKMLTFVTNQNVIEIKTNEVSKKWIREMFNVETTEPEIFMKIERLAKHLSKKITDNLERMDGEYVDKFVESLTERQLKNITGETIPIMNDVGFLLVIKGKKIE